MPGMEVRTQPGQHHFGSGGVETVTVCSSTARS
jgi:hypothetical protein